MAESANYRQIQLEKQKLLLEQRRKSRQAQSGKVTLNQIGSRPSTGKSSRPSSSRSNIRTPSTNKTITGTPNITNTSNTTGTPSTNNITRTPITTGTPSTSKIIGTPGMIISVKPTGQYQEDDSPSQDINQEKREREEEREREECDTPLLPSISNITTTTIVEEREEKRDWEEVEMDMSKRLLSLGISSTLGYESDESEKSNGEELESSKVDQLQLVNEPVISDIPVVPSCNQPSSPEKMQVENPLRVIVEHRQIVNLRDIVFKPPIEGARVRCRITRDKTGMDRYMFPTYYLHMEWDEHERLLLLAARKKKRSRSSYYLISIDTEDMSREGAGFVAKVRSNFLGTSFVAYDNGTKPAGISSPTHGSAARFTSIDRREELVAVQYETNILGFKGPRKMNVVIPCMNKQMERMRVCPLNNAETLLERLKNRELSNLLQLYNKQPQWSEETQAYVLNFHGRVTEASVKNFQLVHATDEDYVIMQFGRISEDSFTMDFSFPMSAVQAFAVALSSFDSKLACE